MKTRASNIKPAEVKTEAKAEAKTETKKEAKIKEVKTPETKNELTETKNVFLANLERVVKDDAIMKRIIKELSELHEKHNLSPLMTSELTKGIKDFKPSKKVRSSFKQLLTLWEQIAPALTNEEIWNAGTFLKTLITSNTGWKVDAKSGAMKDFRKPIRALGEDKFAQFKTFTLTKELKEKNDKAEEKRINRKKKYIKLSAVLHGIRKLYEMGDNKNIDNFTPRYLACAIASGLRPTEAKTDVSTVEKIPDEKRKIRIIGLAKQAKNGKIIEEKDKKVLIRPLIELTADEFMHGINEIKGQTEVPKQNEYLEQFFKELFKDGEREDAMTMTRQIYAGASFVLFNDKDMDRQDFIKTMFGHSGSAASWYNYVRIVDDVNDPEESDEEDEPEEKTTENISSDRKELLELRAKLAAFEKKFEAFIGRAEHNAIKTAEFAERKKKTFDEKYADFKRVYAELDKKGDITYRNIQKMAHVSNEYIKLMMERLKREGVQTGIVKYRKEPKPEPDQKETQPKNMKVNKLSGKAKKISGIDPKKETRKSAKKAKKDESEDEDEDLPMARSADGKKVINLPVNSGVSLSNRK